MGLSRNLAFPRTRIVVTNERAFIQLIESRLAARGFRVVNTCPLSKHEQNYSPRKKFRKLSDDHD